MAIPVVAVNPHQTIPPGSGGNYIGALRSNQKEGGLPAAIGGMELKALQ